VEIPTVVELAALTPDPKNARRRTQRSHALIERSLSEYGAARSIVVDEAGKILAGNGTVEAAASVGIDKVLLVPADGNTLVAVQRTDLTERQKTELAISDNRTSDLSEFDGAAVAQLLEDDEGLDLSPFWTDREFRALVHGIDGNEEKPEAAAGGKLELKLSFATREHMDQFLEACSRLADALPNVWSLEQRIETAIVHFLRN
jgi:hypothetical protein